MILLKNDKKYQHGTVFPFPFIRPVFTEFLDTLIKI